MLAARSMTVVRGAQVVLDEVDLVVDGATRLGVLGRNGAGKSTLLRALAGLEAPAEGSVERAPPGLTVGYLAQEVQADGEEATAAYLRRRTGVAAAELAMEAALAAAQQRAGQAELLAYDDALARYLALGGDDHDARTPRVFAEVGLPERVLDQSLARLSGGQRVKAGLAAILLARFDVLLLDEPTNNLDFDGLDRLERFLAGSDHGIVLVSHDRAFLSATTTRIAEIDLVSHRLEEYGGGYDAYLEERSRRREQGYARYEEAQRERTRLEATARQKKEWSVSRRGQRTTDNDKMLAARRKERSESAAGAAKAIERRIERLGGAEKPWEGWELRMSLRVARRSGQLVASLRGATVERDRFTLGPVDLELHWQDRLALTGPNGSGKSTLLGLVTGELAATSGSARRGAGVVVGHLAQDRSPVGAGDRTLLEAVRDQTGLPAAEARSLLAKFDLTAEHAGRAGQRLSPGERSRAGLAVLMARGTNLLVLDEPTNHLDLDAIEELERALADYDGTLVVVTHDRRFLDGLRVTRRLEVDAGRVGEVAVPTG
jgi:ATPase subunit of ABC transporter with duplicated ATPase domains